MFLASKDIGISLQGRELCGTVCVTGENKRIRLKDLSFSRGKALVKEPQRLTRFLTKHLLIWGEEVDQSANASRADVAHVLAEAATTGRFDGTAQDMQSA